MVLGAMTCQESDKRKVYQDIRELKIQHGISSWREVKWTKVSLSKIDFYLDLINYFFKQPSITYR